MYQPDIMKMDEARILLKKAQGLLDEAGVHGNAYSQVSLRDALDDLEGDMERAEKGLAPL